MRPTLFSAKIPKFDWKEGETFEAELWLLNDAPEAREGRVHVTARVGDEEFDLLDWNAKTDANAHKRGPTVRFVLPHAEGENKVVLTLAAENGMESEYVFMYIPKKKKKVLRQLNV
jgi:beta-mannosidase